MRYIIVAIIIGALLLIANAYSYNDDMSACMNHGHTRDVCASILR